MIKIVVVGMVAAVLAVVVRQHRPDIAIVVSLAGGIVVLSMVINELTGLMDTLLHIADKFSVDSSLIANALKITGVAYIGEFGVQSCKDAGENAIASKVELGTKVLILAMCVPMIVDIITLFAEILP